MDEMTCYGRRKVSFIVPRMTRARSYVGVHAVCCERLNTSVLVYVLCLAAGMSAS